MRIAVRPAAALLAGALLLSGCASTPPNPYASTAAADLQQSVLHVTEAAGAGDHAAALTRLHELEVETKVARARGEISEARSDSILTAIALVRADLEALIAEAKRKAEEEAKRKAEEEATKKAEEEAARKAEEEAAALQAAEEEAARQRAAEQATQEHADDSGNGNGKGKGKGKGKGGDDDDGEGDDD